jgi:hypothetical protein
VIGHVRICQLRRPLLHDMLKVNFGAAYAPHQVWIGEAEATELKSLGIVRLVRHDSPHRCAKPIANLDVRAVCQRKGL